jgi:hypothetical protein
MNLLQKKYLLYEFFAKHKGLPISHVSKPTHIKTDILAPEIASYSSSSSLSLSVPELREEKSIQVDSDSGETEPKKRKRSSTKHIKKEIWESCESNKDCKTNKCDPDIGCISRAAKAADDTLIYNPLTKKYVLKDGEIGQLIHKWKFEKNYSLAKILQRLREKSERKTKKESKSKKSNTKKTRKESSTRRKKAPPEDTTDYIINPLTEEWVKRSGRIGRKIISWLEEGVSDKKIIQQLKEQTKKESDKRQSRRRE